MLGLLCAVLFGLATYQRHGAGIGAGTPLGGAIGSFMAAIGWLLFAGTLALIVVRTAKATRT